MAAPPSKTIKDLNGKWVLNKSLSDDVEPALALQGVSWLVRKGIAVASVTINVQEYEDDDKAVHIDIVQTATGGIKGTTEKRCLDGAPREHQDWLFGKVTGKTRWIRRDEITNEYLKRGWIEGDAADELLLESAVENVDGAGWIAVQIWGFQRINGERRYVRNVVVSKGDEKVEMRMVYDWVGEKLDATTA